MQTFREQEWGGTTVAELMTPMVFDVGEDTPIQRVVDTMLKGRIHRVLVTCQQRLVGIITPSPWSSSSATYSDTPFGQRGKTEENHSSSMRCHWPIAPGFDGR